METIYPSAIPTEDPFPFQTQLVFDCYLKFNGIDRFTFMDDPNVEPAVVMSFARSMNVCQSNIIALDVVDIDVRRRKLRVASAKSAASAVTRHANTDDQDMANVDFILHANYKSVLSSSVQVTLQVSVMLEMLGYSTSESAAAYTALSGMATTAVVGGTYTTLLDSILVEMGAAATLTPDASSFVVGAFTTTVIKTPQPSVQPTFSPTETPTEAPTVGKISADNQGGTTVVDIIIIVTVVGTSLLLVALLVGAYYENEAKMSRKVVPESSLAIVPG